MNGVCCIQALVLGSLNINVIIVNCFLDTIDLLKTQTVTVRLTFYLAVEFGFISYFTLNWIGFAGKFKLPYTILLTYNHFFSEKRTVNFLARDQIKFAKRHPIEVFANFLQGHVTDLIDKLYITNREALL